MIKTNKRTLLLTSLIIVLPLCIGLVLWNQLPNTMATHFGIHGDADGFSSKPFAILFLPLFILAIHWFSVFIISADPRKQNISPKIFTIILWILPIYPKTPCFISPTPFGARWKGLPMKWIFNGSFLVCKAL